MSFFGGWFGRWFGSWFGSLASSISGNVTGTAHGICLTSSVHQAHAAHSAVFAAVTSDVATIIPDGNVSVMRVRSTVSVECLEGEI